MGCARAQRVRHRCADRARRSNCANGNCAFRNAAVRIRSGCPHDRTRRWLWLDRNEVARIDTSMLHLLPIALLSALAGATNSIAGGGTLITFPALVGLGISPLVANATSTVALVPGSLSSML